MKKRVISIITTALLVLSVFTACSKTNTVSKESGNTSNENSQVKDSIVIGQSSDATTLDAQMYSDLATENICLNIYDPIVRVDNEGNILPGVAEKWDVSEDGTEYTFKIKKGIKFHNGNELKASDVKFTLERCKASSYVGTYFSYINNIEVVDESTVVVTLDYAYGSFLPLLGSYSGVVSEDLVSKDENALSRNPIGTGPYKFIEWSQGNKIVLEATDDYHNGPAAIKNLTFKVIGDKSTATISLEKGEIDAFIGIAPTDRETIKSNDNLSLDEVGSYVFRFLGINCEREPFNNVKVRQAIAKVIDKEGIVIGAEDGAGIVAESHIPQGIIGYSADFKGLEYNIEEAKQLLTEAGYPDGFSCEIATTESRSVHAQIIQANLKEIGINVDIKLYEAGTFYEVLENGEYDLQILGWSYICQDPDVAVYDLYKSDTILTGNYARYNNPVMDELLIKGRQSIDQEERQKIYEEVETIVKDDAFNIPLYWTTSNIGFNKDLKGIVASPKLTYFVYNFSW